RSSDLYLSPIYAPLNLLDHRRAGTSPFAGFWRQLSPEQRSSSPCQENEAQRNFPCQGDSLRTSPDIATPAERTVLCGLLPRLFPEHCSYPTMVYWRTSNRSSEQRDCHSKT